MGRRSRRIHRLAPRDDVDREVAFHLAMRERELVEAGWSPAAARLEARRLFGDVAAIREECGAVAVRAARAGHRWSAAAELLGDVKHGARWLAREKGFASLAVLTLALGIGANSAAFGLVDGILLRPLPFASPERLVALWELNDAAYEVPVSWPNFDDWRRAEPATVAGLAAYQPAAPVAVLGGAEPVRARVAGVSGEFFRVLGVPPLLGRDYMPEELAAGGPRAVVVAESFWRGPLGGERDLARLRLELYGMRVQVVGVMPRSFDYPPGSDIWFAVDGLGTELGARDAHNHRAIARLAPGATVATAAHELSALAAGVRARDPQSDAVAVAVRPLREESVGGARRALLLLLGAAGCVLLVACTNLASALLARAAQRRRELAVRAALGASRGRLIRQLLTESLLLAGLGAVAGVLVGWLAIDAVRALWPDAVPRLAEVRLDGRVLGFTTVVALLTGLTFGIAPALRATRAGPFGAMRAGGRSTDSKLHRRGWGVLVGAEVALALLLLVASGLLVRSFWNIVSIDPGFNARGVLTAEIDLTAARYADGAARVRFHDALLERIAGLPGVRAAAMTMAPPLMGWDPNGRFHIEGGDGGDAHYRVVSPGFFETLGVTIVTGRGLDARDRHGALDVVVINDALARRFFAGEDPIGRRIATGGMDGRGDVYATIVGVVADVRHYALTTPPGPGYYLPYMQRPDRIDQASLLVRADPDAPGVADALRAAVRALDADLPVEVVPLRDRVGAGLAERRFTLVLLAAFAGIALLLAAVGIYAVVSFAVARRTREIGIRLALGAEAGRVVWTIGRATMISVAVGLAAGLAGAAALARVTASLLFELDALDPLTFAGGALLLLLVAWVAVLVPARRALRVSPTIALQAE
jgi:putative ABC transport system permease protein